MIKHYQNGKELINEYLSFLQKEAIRNSFFFVNASSIKSFSKTDYAIAVINDNKVMLAMKRSPYCMLLYGDESLVSELVDDIYENKLQVGSVLCDRKIGNAFCQKYFELTNIRLTPTISMDFLVSDQKTLPSSDLVEVASSSDILSVEQLLSAFNRQVNITGNVLLSEDDIKNFRVIKIKGKIICMASRTREIMNNVVISHVYTVPEYRNRGYAKLVVSTLQNEIIDEGKTVGLNVDICNPISTRLYASLGFIKSFNQVEYREEKS